jgi:prepilin-type processing-associated H-X9-DG protein
MHNAALAVLNYESAKKILPKGMTFPITATQPAQDRNGKSIQFLSVFGPNWIIEILPYMEETALRDSFNPKSLVEPYSQAINDDPVQDPLNFKARGTEISSLLCPSDPFNKTLYQGTTSFAGTGKHGGNWARTNYAANAGRAPLFNDAVSTFGATSKGWKDQCTRGVMGPNVAVTLKRITDGTSKTIMLAEIRAGLTEGDMRGVWAMGHAGASLVAHFGSGGDADGPNYCQPRADDVISDICGTGGGLCSGTGGLGTTQQECMGCYNANGEIDEATLRSKHPGGAHVAMADGSVNWINDDIETTGCYGPCCTAWDYMIASGDNQKAGALQSNALSGLCN